ncbi:MULTISPECIES: 16S rRNA (guanine(966)-N(2))-methyltransferase RsmD [Modicisalibacter]|uniref:16S rRNA (guanine(966)-N(2))-methyltransferase RsmD n=1 Tax=Modicisalibacter TaxID=574347 RepID=UPI00100BCB44|nr:MULTISPECIES: 16S rRNA (guanine(966)-N(2))-methyltransferase RsmD [Halomonadaceae]MBZ9558181.1 16S rRNA (guanine(966)-N(2))-methyltransferase RsmD [Modicisalibacter sp. R2A 31.J]MBZ9573150.1 16S rRNA (guanine(966)-N(2))-methyltransferase RsmD [Modicisalibacter sp. MOD 31.J]
MSRHRSRKPAPRRTDRATSPRGGKLRIIGGRFKRRLLSVPDSPGLRPTPDRVRETLFNWLAFELAGRRVLDLYAGTGALGLEALSRGAAQAVFVEAQPAVARALEANVVTLGVEARVVGGDTQAYLAGPATPFELVFLDPPFRQGYLEPTCAALESGGWLAAGAWVYVEHESELEPNLPGAWSLHREVRAGDTRGRLYHRLASPPGDAC